MTIIYHNKCNLKKIRDELITKRIAQYKESGVISYSKHMCAILKNGVPIEYGTNVYTPNVTIMEHAESQAFKKLLRRLKIKNKLSSSKRIKVDVLIIRTNGSNSRPCIRCIQEMNHLKDKINIRTIHYTTKDELSGIRSVKFSSLLNEEQHICSYDSHHKIYKS